mgnify:CR=1 FL=1
MNKLIFNEQGNLVTFLEEEALTSWDTKDTETIIDAPDDFVLEGYITRLVDGEVVQEEEDVSGLLAYAESIRYINERAQAYPSIGDQLDALYHAGVFPSEMADQIQAVKEAYPKPSEE